MKTALKHLALGASILASTAAFSSVAQAKEDFKVCWSIYVGWMPWEYGATSGIVKKCSPCNHLTCSGATPAVVL